MLQVEAFATLRSYRSHLGILKVLVRSDSINIVAIFDGTLDVFVRSYSLSLEVVLACPGKWLVILGNLSVDKPQAYDRYCQNLENYNLYRII